MTDEMKPVRCRCGGEPIVEYIEKTSYLPKDKWYIIGCPKCDICLAIYNTEAEAITAWNRAMGADQFREVTKMIDTERTAKVEELEKRSETMISWEGKCSNCGAYTNHEMNYCFECGCRLEWE